MEKIYLMIIGVIFLIIVYQVNSIIYLKNRAKRSYSTIDIYLKKRFDLIPNLIETVKGYANYEKSTIERITKLRNEFNNGNKNAGKELNDTYSNLLAVAESYPDLKASENFLQLQKALTKVEDEISASRRLYINDVTNYNTKIQKLPYNILAKLFNYKPMELLSFVTEEINIKF